VLGAKATAAIRANMLVGLPRRFILSSFLYFSVPVVLHGSFFAADAPVPSVVVPAHAAISRGYGAVHQ
ncbi:MAG TPA: hypothetical protein VLF15_03290, partial [Pseudoxanthomonas sp.]|nr:hypothetical protein [Pseudoxanthomonas sp.]